ncbi:hypothetical protein [Rhizobium sp. Root1220]|uniref:hypothetical protein n=1 Tax=Rhizobium sp. Root1220 TaxID=1736432 RepID=UPI000AECEEFE|nr:hypothetical protein [Rhizobium sp. Root1220]
MRAQSKPFIVEIKTSRRPDRSQPKSIWGNLDLTAVAEDVAEDNQVNPNPVSADTTNGR